MRAWTDTTFASLLALGLGVLGAAGCTNPDPLVGGSNPSSPEPTPLRQPPACAPAIGSSAVFEPTAALDLARFQLVAATSSVVLASSGTSLHRSLDEGKTWSLVDAPELRGADVLALASFGSEIFVSVTTQDGRGLFRSADDGATWTSASSDGCSMPTYLTSDGKSLFAAEAGAVYEWDAATTSWQPLPAADEAFDVIESDGAYVYGNSKYSPGVYRVELGKPDASWSPVPDLPAWGYLAFAFDGVRGVAANATEISMTVDGGASWKLVDILVPEVKDFLAVGGTMLAAGAGGLMSSSDGGATWDQLDHAGFARAFSLAATGSHVFAANDTVRRASPADLGEGGWEDVHVAGDEIDTLQATRHALLALSGIRLVNSFDGGASWSASLIDGNIGGLTNVAVRRGPQSDTVLALSWTPEGSVAVVASTDDGVTFQQRGVIPGANWAGFLSVTDRGLVVGINAGAGNYCEDVQDVTTTLYLSTDDGVSWTEDMNHFPITFTDCYGESYPPALTGVTEAAGSLFATTMWKGTYRSADGGASWKPIETPEAIGVMSSITEIDGPLVGIASAGGVARSIDGVTWEPAGLTGLAVASLVRADGLLFASVPSKDPSEAGVYGSNDGGASWARVDATFDARVVNLTVQDGRLFAGTLDESVWTAPLACTSSARP